MVIQMQLKLFLKNEIMIEIIVKPSIQDSENSIAYSIACTWLCSVFAGVSFVSVLSIVLLLHVSCQNGLVD